MIRLVPQARVVIIQRLGRYLKTAGSGPVFVIPFADRILPMIDLREQVVPFDPQPVITEDNVGIQIATVVYYQIVDARNATYQVANLVLSMEQLTMTTLRNVIGGLTLDKTLTSREEINSKMRAALDEVTEGWGVRVTRVERGRDLRHDRAEDRRRLQRQRFVSHRGAQAAKTHAEGADGAASTNRYNTRRLVSLRTARVPWIKYRASETSDKKCSSQ